jgi:hypothetical protein
MAGGLMEASVKKASIRLAVHAAIPQNRSSVGAICFPLCFSESIMSIPPTTGCAAIHAFPLVWHFSTFP